MNNGNSKLYEIIQIYSHLKNKTKFLMHICKKQIRNIMARVKIIQSIYDHFWASIETKLHKTVNRSLGIVKYDELANHMNNILKSKKSELKVTSGTLYKMKLKQYKSENEIVTISKAPYTSILFAYLDCTDINDYVTKNKVSFSDRQIEKQLKLNLTKSIQFGKTATDESSISTFANLTSFTNYLEKRLLRSEENDSMRMVKSVHFSDKDLYPTQNFKEVISSFITNGGALHRIISFPHNLKLKSDIETELKEMDGHKYLLSTIPEIILKDIGMYNFLIIDDEEVCIGGVEFQNTIPTIVHRDRRVVEFYKRYFTQLLEKANYIKSLTNYDKIAKNNWKEFINKTTHKINEFEITKFEDDQEFNEHIKKEYENASAVKIISLSHSSTDSKDVTQTAFDDILDEWLKKDIHKCIHIISYRKGMGRKRLRERIEKSIENKTDHSYYYLPQTSYDEQFGHFAMIVDDKKVYFRNSYSDKDQNKDVSIFGTNQEHIVKFWTDRFQHLKQQAKPIKLGIAWKNLDVLQSEHIPKGTFKTYDSDRNFHKVFRERIKDAKKIYSISFIQESEDSIEFETIREQFLQQEGCEYHSIRSQKSLMNIEKTKNRITKYHELGYNYYYNYIPEISFEKIEGLSMMLIDDKEVYFHNGRDIEGFMIIECNLKTLINFWKARFTYLLKHSKKIYSPHMKKPDFSKFTK